VVAGAGCAEAGEDVGVNDSAATTEQQGACSEAYWTWVLGTMKPAMTKPIGEVSEEKLLQIASAPPPSNETRDTYAICWTPIFNENFFGAAWTRLHQASTTYLDAKSPDYRSYPRYLENAAMTPELRRNAKALLMLRPSTMSPIDVPVWMTAYNTLVGEVIHPVGMPGLHEYAEVKEDEWVIDAPEAEYLAVVEGARAKPSADGAYGEWMRNAADWLFGPPPTVSRSFVFNVPWEPAADAGGYGLGGVRLYTCEPSILGKPAKYPDCSRNGTPFLPDEVRAFVDRLKATRPEAIGSEDSAAWMISYNARMLRALSNLAQQQPILTQTDTLALDLLEEIKPAKLQGLFTYEHWVDLTVLASQTDPALSKRLVSIEPCVEKAELDAATKTRDEKSAGKNVTVPAPHVCGG
jgi:hypothetical protein